MQRTQDFWNLKGYMGQSKLGVYTLQIIKVDIVGNIKPRHVTYQSRMTKNLVIIYNQEVHVKNRANPIVEMILAKKITRNQTYYQVPFITYA
jgi:hypothetical protein